MVTKFRRHALTTTVTGVPFAVCPAVAVVFRGQPSIKRPAALEAMVIALAGLLLQGRRFGRAACPACGERMERFDAALGKCVRFRCLGCDVVWDTGMKDEADIEG